MSAGAEIPCPWVVQRQPAPGLPPLFFAIGAGARPTWSRFAHLAMQFSTAAFGELLVSTITPDHHAAVLQGDPASWLR